MKLKYELNFAFLSMLNLRKNIQIIILLRTCSLWIVQNSAIEPITTINYFISTIIVDIHVSLNVINTWWTKVVKFLLPYMRKKKKNLWEFCWCNFLTTTPGFFFTFIFLLWSINHLCLPHALSVLVSDSLIVSNKFGWKLIYE